MEDASGGPKMMRNFIIVLLAGAVVLSGCGKKEAPGDESRKNTPPGAETTDPIQHKVMSFDLEGLTEKGTKNWDVKGDAAESISETQIKLHNIRAKSYGEDTEAVITASSGIYDKAKNNVRLQNNVKATIESTQSGAKEVFNFPDALDASKAKAKRPSVNEVKKTKTVITCDADVLFDYQNNCVYFNKNVNVVSDDGSINADKITVHLDPVTRKIVNIEAEGNVKMTKGESVTYSEKATYVEADKKVALIGQPKLVVYQEGSLSENFFGADDASTRNTRSN